MPHDEINEIPTYVVERFFKNKFREQTTILRTFGIDDLVHDYLDVLDGPTLNESK